MEENILQKIFESRKADLSLMEFYLDRIPANKKSKRKTIRQEIETKGISQKFNTPFLITELKPKSPSKGSLIKSNTIDPAAIARQMENAGSSAISVLTEPHYFGGSFEILTTCCEHTNLPILMKDFVFDPIQIQIARKLGASNILLITGYSNLESLLTECKNLNVEPLIEIHSKDDIDVLLPYIDIIKEIGIIGINNRDLKTLSIDLETTRKLYPILRAKFGVNVPIITESGFQSHSEIREFLAMGLNGFLIGTSIMQSGNIAEKIHALMGEK